MKREEADKKHICVKCKWCEPKTIEHQSWTEYRFYCKNAVSFIDPVKGDESYMDCIFINSEAECPDYEEPNTSWFERFIDALFGRKKNYE